MVTADQISHVERVVSRKYMNRSFLATALTAADRVDEQASTDGNRKLALLGKSLVDLILHDATPGLLGMAVEIMNYLSTETVSLLTD